VTKGFFITGTDTDVGKTWVTVALMRFFKNQGLSVIGLKPVAAGCKWQDGQLKNDDALLLQQNSSINLPYQTVNPYAFEQPVSPHLAAMGLSVQLDVIVQIFNKIKHSGDVVLMEGAGGWLAPLNDVDDIADLAKLIQLPVIVVVAIRLGCINHTRLTVQAIQMAGLACAGWIAVCLDPEMAMQKENITTISHKVSIPLLGVMPYSEKADFDLLVKSISGECLI